MTIGSPEPRQLIHPLDDRMVLLTPTGVVEHAAPDGLVVVSQDCDVVQHNRPNLMAAKIVHEPDPARSASRTKGREPRYVPLSGLGDGWFADLDFMACLAKTDDYEVGGVAVLPQDAPAFRRAVGRRFSRHPFDDDVDPFFRALAAAVYERKYLLELSGRILELRVGSPDWQRRPLHVEILAILPAGELPAIGQEPVPSSPRAHELVRAEDPHRLARALLDDECSAADSHVLWAGLLRSVAHRGLRRTAAPVTFECQVEAEDEITYDRVRATYLLDLEHLS